MKDTDGEKRMKQYDAFISYRHLEKDKRIAVRLQRLLERGKLIDENTGKKRSIHIFRDQSELPTSDNLEQEIREALENSRFLIILCSPETKKSEYCLEEVRYFRALHGNTNVHILPVLLEGEPEEVFPEELMFSEREIVDDEGNVRIIREEIEPLAADVRSDNVFGMLKKLYATEYMRLKAPIMGVPYDKLYKRKLRQRIYQGAGIGCVLLAASLAFGLYNAYMLRQLAEKQEKILTNEAIELAYSSEMELKNGNRSGALEKALAALPSKEMDRPVMTVAVNALADALYAYRQPVYHTEHVIELQSEVYDAKLSKDGSYLVTLDFYGGLRVYCCSSESELWRMAVDQFDEYSAPEIVILESQQAILLIKQKEADLYSMADGTLLRSISFEELECSRYGYAWDARVSNDEKTLAVNVSDRPEELGSYESYQYLAFYDLETGKVKIQTDILPVPLNCVSESTGIFLPDDSVYIGAFHDYTEDVYYLVYVDAATGEVLRTPWVKGAKSKIEFDLSLTYVQDTTVEGVVLYLCEYDIGSSSGTTHIGYLPDGAEEWGFYDTYSQMAETGNPPYVFSDNFVFVFLSGTTAVRINMVGNEVKRVQLSENGIYCQPNSKTTSTLLVNEDGSIDIFDRSSFKIYESLSYELTSFYLEKGFGPMEWEGPFCVVPQSENSKVYVCEMSGDKNGVTVSETEDEDLLAGELYVMPGGNTILCLTRESAEEEKPEGYTYWYRINGTIYDMGEQTVIDRFSFEQQLFLSDFSAISADGRKLFFGQYIYDLSAHELIQPEGIDNKSLKYHSFQSVATEEGVLSAAWDGTAMNWWIDGGDMHRSPPCPEELEIWSADSDYVSASKQGNYVLGKNGLMVVKNCGDSDQNKRYISHFMIYSVEDDAWDKAEDISKVNGYPHIAVADRQKWVAVADCDNVLRIYDQASECYIREFSTGLTNYAIKEMYFILNDRFLLIVQGGIEKGSSLWISILDAESGAVVASYYPENGGYLSDIQFLISENRKWLCIFDAKGYMDGLCINLDDWEIIYEIPHLRCVLADEKLFTGYSWEAPTMYPYYDMDTLIAWAQEELDSKAE